MTRQELEARLATAAAARAPARRGDDLFATGAGYEGALRPAAVLIGVVARRSGPFLLLTQRTHHLRDHAGQISFPGGRIEPEDATPELAALREAEEEIGLAPTMVDVVGRLDTYETRTGFEVFPIVGFVAPEFVSAPDPFEVEAVFEVPLAFVMDPRNHVVEERMFKGTNRRFYVLQYGDYRIWGATAGMLVNLFEVLADI